MFMYLFLNNIMNIHPAIYHTLSLSLVWASSKGPYQTAHGKFLDHMLSVLSTSFSHMNTTFFLSLDMKGNFWSVSLFLLPTAQYYNSYNLIGTVISDTRN